MKINRTTTAYDVIRAVLTSEPCYCITDEDYETSFLVEPLYNQTLMYNDILARKDDIPKSVTFEQFLLTAFKDIKEATESNIVSLLDESKQLIITGIKNGKDIMGLVETKELADKYLKSLHVSYLNNEFKILGEWKEYQTELAIPLDEAVKLFEHSIDEIIKEWKNALDELTAKEILRFNAKEYRIICNYLYDLDNEIAEKYNIKYKNVERKDRDKKQIAEAVDYIKSLCPSLPRLPKK